MYMVCKTAELSMSGVEILSTIFFGTLQLEHSLDSLLHWVDETGMQLEHVTRESVSIDPTGVKDQLKKSKVRITANYCTG